MEIIVNKKLKHSYISISPDKKVVVKTPYKSQHFVDELLDNKAQWIAKKLLQIDQKQLLHHTQLHTLEFLQSRVKFYSSMMRLPYKELKFRKMRRRWGSCSSSGVITLNKEMLRLEEHLVDYIVVHELAHLKHMNHSKKFHALVEQYLLNAQTLRKELKNIQIIST
ncbi:M48 family metallopeptidase [Sulfurimonas sp.]|uniref:M48 family metallopeptidase n=1 Tax=Sulfurimonas sp. TaxID=2022749 RepID=UPI003D0D5B0C